MAEHFLSTDKTAVCVQPIIPVSFRTLRCFENNFQVGPFRNFSCTLLIFPQLRESSFDETEIREHVQCEDFHIPGPRKKDFSLDPECRTVLNQTFKNADCSMWSHNHDLMVATDLLKTDFLSDIRHAAGVSVFLFSNLTIEHCTIQIQTPIGAITLIF